MENTFIILQKQEKCYGLDVFANFASHGWKEELEKREKLDEEDDASDLGGDGYDADLKIVYVLPW